MGSHGVSGRLKNAFDSRRRQGKDHDGRSDEDDVAPGGYRARGVLCRHERLAPLHAGLLMKLTEYVQEEEEGHLRCRWGEGNYCYGGDVNSNGMMDYTPP